MPSKYRVQLTLPPAVFAKVVELAAQDPDLGVAVGAPNGVSLILRTIICKYFGHDPEDNSAGQGRVVRDLVEQKNRESNKTWRERSQQASRRRTREIYQQQYPHSEPKRKKDSK